MNNQYTYNRPPMGEMVPQPQAQMPIRQRMMSGVIKMKDAFPKWLSQYSIAVYILALMAVSFMYSSYSLPWYHFIAGIISIVVFFLYSSSVVKDTAVGKITKAKLFEKHIFWIAFIPRVIFTILIYWIFMENYGDSFGFEHGDAEYYDDLGVYVAKLIENGNFHFYNEISRWCGNDDISDMGYGIYVGFVYILTGNSIVVVRLLKCLMSAYCAILIYRLARRNFDEQTARLAAIFVALWPNFWYYCGTHLKETEMVFLGVLFVEQADQMLRSRQFTAWKVAPVLLIGAANFGFRTPLAIIAFLSLAFTMVISSTKVVSWGKRIIVGGLAVLLIGVTMGNRIQEESRQLLNVVKTDEQKSNMEWRGEREHGNALAKYAGASVFAPMIFTLPFPTMVRPYEGQEEQQLLNGGNFVKNIMSAFTIFALVMMIMSGKWRDHLLPLSFMLGYVVVLTMSSFAQSERFHQPAMPFEFMFAAYGLSIAVTKKKYKRWFTYWCGLMLVAAIAWNWFKLAGRGLT